MEKLVYLKDVVTLRIDRDKCKGCGACLLVCPRDVLSRLNGKVDVTDRDACIECGACRQNCPEEAISVRSGVGCAAAVINSFFGRTDSSCCCVIDPDDPDKKDSTGPTCSPGCC